MRPLLPVLLFALAGLMGLAPTAARASFGYLFVVNSGSGGNVINTYRVNENNGTFVLSTTTATGGVGSVAQLGHEVCLDQVNRRLYVLNTGSNSVSAYAINAPDDPLSGPPTLTELPFSPIPLGPPSGNFYRAIAVHPSGSPLLIGDNIASSNGNNRLLSYRITATSATFVGRSVSRRPSEIAFSQDGRFVYVASSQDLSGFAVDPATGALSALPGSPYPAGLFASALVTDAAGRIFLSTFVNGGSDPGNVHAYTTAPNGVADQVSGSPFPAGLFAGAFGLIHPRGFYFVSDDSTNLVGGFAINGQGDATTLDAVPGSPFAGGGSGVEALALTRNSRYLYAVNADSRTITIFQVDPGTGALTQGFTASGNTTGNTQGVAYLPVGPLVVTKVEDTDDGVADADTSLREAIEAARPGDTIVFASPLFDTPRTITLSDAAGLRDLAITKDLTIEGPGADLLTIRRDPGATAAFRIFSIPDTTATVTLRGMTITGGNADSIGGGGIFNNGTLRIEGCHIAANTSFSPGGGILNFDSGTLTVLGSTISNNTAGGGGFGFSGGGGITNRGTLLIANSTVSGNVKTGGNSSAGGISSIGLSAVITDSTITDNRAEGINSAGGVLRGFGTVTVRNSIVAANRDNATFPDVGGAVTSGGHNLVGAVGSGTSFSQNGDQTGVADPGLGPLQNNGGPTPTHALLPGSPAINTGDSALGVDQRGVARPQNGSDDIGSVEIQIVNRAPTADAGPDQSVQTTGPTAQVTLTGSGSDPDGDAPLTFRWRENGVQIATGPNPTVVLGVGTHTLTLEVSDPSGAVGTDTVVITVVRVAQNVTGQIRVGLGALRIERATGRTSQPVTLTNIGGSAIAGPVSLVLDSLPAGVTLINRDGTTSAVLPAGSATRNGAADGLAPGASVTLLLEFTRTGTQAITFNARVLAGPGAR